MSQNNIPWFSMNTPVKGMLSTLRVRSDQKTPWYWVKCRDEQFGIAIQIPLQDAQYIHLNHNYYRLNILKIRGENDDCYLCIVIGSSELSKVFYHLCLDLISSCEVSITYIDTINIVKNRVLAWQRLFEKENKLLTPQECMGLIAELQFLKEHWISKVSRTGVYGWKGPLGKSQDFIDEKCELSVEIKTRAFDSNIINISSRQQLNSPHSLYLIVYPCTMNTEQNGITLNEFIKEVRQLISPQEYAIFDERLLNVGYIQNENYDSFYFNLGKPKSYVITENFPKLTDINIPIGIGRVKYDIDLDSVSEHLCPIEKLHIKGC